MATKTISIDLEAYERLDQARRARSESFSKVIKRAVWPAAPHTGAALLGCIAGLPVMDEESLAELEEGQRTDAPPADPWHR